MKTEWSNNAANRREFLRGGLRYALLTAVGAVSATLASKPGVALPGQTCINQGICSGCNAFTDCGLPQALSAKQFNPRSSHRQEAQSHPGRNPNLLTSAAPVEQGAI